MRLTNGQHCNPNALLRHFFGGLHLQPKRVSPNRERVVELMSRNADVVEMHKK
jgi:hypothetical protein